jgi:iron complex outermembrane recepter protein
MGSAPALGLAAALALPGVGRAAEGAPAADSLEEVVVTGTLLRRSQSDMATPIIAVSQEQIAKTGATNVGDLLKYIPQNIGSSGGVQDLAKGGTDSHDARSVNLRGLGAGATLVLLNGRRVVPSEGYVNLNSMVPTIAISRMDTSLGGSSATYGADAVAGVVNLITNSDFQGFKASAQYTNLSKANDIQVQAMIGAGGERYHMVGSISYTSLGRLQNGDRDVTNFFNASSGTGANPGTFTMAARPTAAGGGDVIIGGNNYSTLYDTFKNAAGVLTVVDPQCGSAATSSIYVPAANSPGFGLGSCRFSFQAQNPLRPNSNSLLMHGDGTFDVTDHQKIYMEFAGYHQDSNRWGVPSYAQNHNAGALPTMPANNPYNPFGVAVGFSGRAIGSQGFNGYNYRVERDQVDQFHTVVGTKGQIAGDWQYDASFTWSRSSVTLRDKDTDMNLFQAALSGFGGPNCNYRYNGPGPGAVAGQGNCMWYSPFAKDNMSQSTDLIFNLQSNVFTNQIRDYRIVDAVANGSLFDLPAGAVQLAVGVQRREELQEQIFSDLALSGFGGFIGPSRNTAGDRTVKSLYSEASAPLAKGLSLDIAARYEDYGAFKNTSPKAELNWKAVPDFLSMRVSYGKSFQAPGIENSTASQISSGVTQITDPVTGVTTFRTVITLGNPNLQPQTAKAYNLGVTLQPFTGSQVSLDYWNYEYENRIQTQNAQAVINADPSGPNVLRDTNGVAQTIITRTFNAPSGTRTSGIDLTASQSTPVWGGKVSLRDTLTVLTKYDIDTGALVYDGIGRRNSTTTSPVTAAAAPRVRNVLSADWGNGVHSVGLSWRYTSSVKEDFGLAVAATPTATIAAWSVVDAQYQFKFGQDSRYDLTLGVINLFDKAPGAAVFTGYLSSVADALGRQAYLKAAVSL